MAKVLIVNVENNGPHHAKNPENISPPGGPKTAAAGV
jgi:hypothetical protein